MDKIGDWMNSAFTGRKKYAFIIYLLMIFWWSVALQDTQANYAVYLFLAFWGVTAVCKQSLGVRTELQTMKEKAILGGTAVFLALAVLLANYDLVSLSAGKSGWLYAAGLLFSGVVVFYLCLLQGYGLWCGSAAQPRQCTRKGREAAFFVPFLFIVAIDVFYLLGVAYPGTLSPDSIDQLNEIESGSYSNHHPFFHTMLIRIFYKLGWMLFHDVNAAVATYSIFQICLMAGIFSFAILTLYEMGARKKYVVMAMMFYTLLPYHWIYASTMWKDVIFAGMCLLQIVSVYRAKRQLGNRWLNDVLMVVSAFGVCLFRTNGFYAYGIMVFCVAISFLRNRKERYIFILLFLSFLVSALLRGPFLSYLNVSQPDSLEALSIPIQQVARVIYDEKELPGEVEEVIGLITENKEEIRQRYVPYISDILKAYLRDNGAVDIIAAHREEFGEMWLQLGLKYPKEYLKAWIDQTKGYWNAGYPYWVWWTGIQGNTLGIERAGWNEGTAQAVQTILDWFGGNDVSRLLTSIGMCTWIYVALLSYHWMNRKGVALETVLPLAVILTLLVASPVYCEFRYAYSLYAALPFVLFCNDSRLKNNISAQ